MTTILIIIATYLVAKYGTFNTKQLRNDLTSMKEKKARVFDKHGLDAAAKATRESNQALFLFLQLNYRTNIYNYELKSNSRLSTMVTPNAV